MTVTLNPSNLGASVSLSAGNLKWCTNNGGGVQGAVSSNLSPYATTGKFYFEFNTDFFANNTQWGIGLANASAGVTNGYVGADANSGGFYRYNSVCVLNGPGFSGGAQPVWGNDEACAIAYDIAAGKIWIRTSAGWASGDPGTGVGGTSFTLTGAIGPFFSVYGSTANTFFGTVNFGASAYVYTPPTGFVNVGAFASNSATLSATIPAMTFSGTAASVVPVTRTKSNNQNVAGGALPVFVTTNPGLLARYPNIQGVVAGAIPVHFVTGPSTTQNNLQSIATGAIPVFVTSAPATTGPYPNDQTLNTGAIPVYEAGALGVAPYPNQQGQATGAMPVWRVN